MNQPHLPSTIWFEILSAGFNAQSQSLSTTSDLTIFRKWALRAGYVNFPFGVRTEADHAHLLQADTLHGIQQMGVDLLRVNWPDRFGGYANARAIRLPEANIPQLHAWSEDQLDSDLRYKIRRSKREGVRLRHATLDDANKVFRLYLQTVQRHGGRKRYSEAYFRALCRTSKHCPELVALIAETAEGEYCGFNISAYREGVAYYLHGGLEDRHAHLRPGFVLMNEAIALARDAGCHEFNFMPSPADQPSLLQFKKKWGAMAYNINHFDIPLSIKGRFIRAALRWGR